MVQNMYLEIQSKIITYLELNLFFGLRKTAKLCQYDNTKSKGLTRQQIAIRQSRKIRFLPNTIYCIESFPQTVIHF